MAQKRTRIQPVCNKLNVIDKIFKFAKQYRLNAQKIIVFARYEFAASECTTLSHYITTLEHDIIVNKNNVRSFFKIIAMRFDLKLTTERLVQLSNNLNIEQYVETRKSRFNKLEATSNTTIHVNWDLYAKVLHAKRLQLQQQRAHELLELRIKEHSKHANKLNINFNLLAKVIQHKVTQKA